MGMASTFFPITITTTPSSRPALHHNSLRQGNFGHRKFCPCLHLLQGSSFSRIRKPNLQRRYAQNSIPGISVVEEDDKSQGEEEDEECELVNGTEITIGDSIDAYLLKAVKNNNGVGVLLLSDIFGFEDSSTRDFAYRVACNGYNVLVPDLFRRDPWRKDRPMARLDEWIAKQAETVVEDIDASAKWMADEFVAVGISKKLGVIGFCYGGGRVIDLLARDQGAIFGIGVSFYGTRINKSVASNIKAPVLFITGDDDPLCPVDALKDVARNIGHGSKVVVFKGRGHGFAHRPDSVEEDKDAEEAFLLMRNWLHNGLVSES